MNFKAIAILLFLSLGGTSLAQSDSILADRNIRSDDGAFSILFPAPPTIDFEESKMGNLTQYLYEDTNGVQYYAEWRKRQKDDSDENAYLGEKYGFEYSMLAEVSSPKTKRKKGVSRITFDARTDEDEIYFLIVLTRKRYYRIAVGIPEEATIEVDYKEFLDSFALIK